VKKKDFERKDGLNRMKAVSTILKKSPEGNRRNGDKGEAASCPEGEGELRSLLEKNEVNVTGLEQRRRDK